MGTGFLFSDGSYLDMTELSKLLGAHSDVEIRVWIVGCKTYNLDGYFTQQNQLVCCSMLSVSFLSAYVAAPAC
eukprot:m.14319 g.14319  ORF g.14319 m.14319 type:complete len:73 (-) comp4774_c0_seq2:669-887(-)